MNAGEQVSRLERLLETIGRNIARPRAAAVPPAAAAAPSPPSPPPPVAVVASPTVSIDAGVDELLGSPPPAEVAAARPELVSAVEVLEEDEFVEIAEEAPAAAAKSAPAPEIEVGFAEPGEDGRDEPQQQEREEVPASSRRPKPLGSELDEALADAGAQAEEEREVPLKTPPPESGRQIAGPTPGHISTPPLPRDLGGAGELELDDLSADRTLAPSEPLSGDRPVPSMAQLGETIELEGAEAPSAALELAEAPAAQQARAAADELEAPLPATAAAGHFDTALEPPPEARDELRRLRSEPPPAPSTPSTPRPLVPELQARPPAPVVAAASFEPAPPPFEPRTFLELLDASLGL